MNQQRMNVSEYRQHVAASSVNARGRVVAVGLLKTDKPKPSKYRNKKVKIDGIISDCRASLETQVRGRMVNIPASTPRQVDFAQKVADRFPPKSVEFVVPYPVSSNRNWRAFNGRTIVSPESRGYKEEVRQRAKSAFCPRYEGNVSVSYTLHPRMNKDGSPSKTRIDLGNCEKVVSDSLNKLAWVDDKQIVRIVLAVGAPMLEGGLTVRIEGLN